MTGDARGEAEPKRGRGSDTSRRSAEVQMPSGSGASHHPYAENPRLSGDGAQAEAERIVWYFTSAVERHVRGGDRASGDERIDKGERLVAALAAAIEYRRAEKSQDRAFAQEDRVGELAAADDAAEWAVALDEAIEALGVDSEPPEESALRARAGEET